MSSTLFPHTAQWQCHEHWPGQAESSLPSHSSDDWFTTSSPQTGQRHSLIAPAAGHSPGQSASAVPSQVSTWGSMTLLPQSGSSFDATSYANASILVSASCVSPVVGHAAAPYFSSAFAKQPAAGVAPPSNFVWYFAIQTGSSGRPLRTAFL